MNAEQVNALGGCCELAGVAFLVRDLMSLARYRDKPREWAAWLKAWSARTVAAARRKLGLPEHWTLKDAGASVDMMLGLHASAVVIPEPYRPRPDLSVQEQIEELGRLLNQVGDAVGKSSTSVSRPSPPSGRRDARRYGPRPKSGSTATPSSRGTSTSCEM